MYEGRRPLALVQDETGHKQEWHRIGRAGLEVDQLMGVSAAKHTWSLYAQSSVPLRLPRNGSRGGNAAAPPRSRAIAVERTSLVADVPVRVAGLDAAGHALAAELGVVGNDLVDLGQHLVLLGLVLAPVHGWPQAFFFAFGSQPCMNQVDVP